MGTLRSAYERGHCVVELRGEDEVALGEAVDFVGPDLGAHLAPREVNVGRVSLFLGDPADTVHVGKRFSKVFEPIFLA